MDWKSLYYQNDCTTQNNLQIQYNSCQITNDTFHRIRTKKFTICMEAQGLPNGSVVRICLPMQEMLVQSLGQEDPLEKKMAAHSSILAWEISWTEEPARL